MVEKMSCDDKKCKYNGEYGCEFMYMGSGIPKDAPCYNEHMVAYWIETKINPNMLKCSNCQFMVNKSVIYDYTDQEPLVYKFCPWCGARMDGEEKDG